MWIRVIQTYDHVFPSRAMRTYQPGRYNVPHLVAERAIAKGKAVAIEPPEDLKSTKGGGTVERELPMEPVEPVAEAPARGDPKDRKLNDEPPPPPVVQPDPPPVDELQGEDDGAPKRKRRGARQ